MTAQTVFSCTFEHEPNSVHRLCVCVCVYGAHDTASPSPSLPLTFGRGGVQTLSKQCRLS